MKIPTITIGATLIGLILLMGLANNVAVAQLTQLRLQMRDGSLLNVTVDEDGIDWRDVHKDFAAERVLWKDIRQLTLIESPVGNQIKHIESLFRQLTSEKYSEREQAETELKNPSVTAPFQSLLKKRMSESDDSEFSHRLRRILYELEGVEFDVGSEFDGLQLANSESVTDLTRKGDAGDLVIAGKIFDGNKIAFDRSNVLRVVNVSTTPKVTATPPTQNTARAITKTHNKIDRKLFSVSSEMISFETDPAGNPISVRKQVDDVYNELGLLMRTEFAGYIELNKYPFKFCPIETGDKCVYPFNANTQKRLRGASIISFCNPGQPNVVAGVSKFGVFIESVEHSRDFVVEAYNFRNQLIGMVEASDQVCIFAGFETAEPIVKIRIARNDALTGLEREIDETYAFDCVFMGPTSPIAELYHINRSKTRLGPFSTRINLKTGDQLIATESTISTDQIKLTNPHSQESNSYPWSEVRSVAFAQLDDQTRKNKTIKLQLADGSIVNTEPESIFSSFDFIGHEFDQQKVVGIWSETCRYPQDIEFQFNKPVIVYPGCQIVADELETLKNGFTWNSETSIKHVQDVVLSDGGDPFQRIEDPDPDLTPKENRVEFTEPKSGEVTGSPTLWFSKPTPVIPGNGHIHFSDGQYFVLNGENGFSIEKIDSGKRMVVVRLGELTKAYPFTRLVSISLPNSKLPGQ